jgi:hypothetical protein
MRRIFWGYCRNRVLIDPLHYLSSHSAFGVEFAEIFVIEKRLPDSASRRLYDLASRGVADSPTRRIGESTTRRVGESAFECRRVDDSPTRLIGEWLPVTPRLGESASGHGESRSRYSNFLKFSIDFPDFKRLNQPFKRSI